MAHRQIFFILAMGAIAGIFASCELGGIVKWPSYTIVYNANGGTGAMKSVTVAYGTAADLSPNVYTRTGYIFKGWAQAPAGSVQFTDGQNVNKLAKETGAKIQLYAVWQPITYTVVYNANGGAGTMGSSVFAYDEEKSLSSNTFTNGEYIFAGWAESSGGALEYSNQQKVKNLSAADNETVTLYALWGSNTYTVSYNANGGNGEMDDSVFYIGVLYKLRENMFSRDHYTFTGWATTAGGIVVYADDAELISLSSAMSGTVMTLYAQWKILDYTVNFDSQGGSAVDSQIVEWNTIAAMPADPIRSDYFFRGWFTEAACINSWDFATTITGNITLYAKWSNSIIEVVRINGGTFTMGSPTTEPSRSSDETQHQVTVSAFWMGKYQVTQEQYQTVTGTNPSSFNGSSGKEPAAGEIQGKRPVEMVTWYDAVEFCNKLSAAEGLTPAYTIAGRTPVSGYPITSATVTANWSANGYRLPTEAEWEYACRAGTTTAYNTGAAISDSTGWYTSNSGSKTHEVGKKPANAWGLYDTHGNVYEWCWDWYGSYASGAQTNPQGPATGSNRVKRGGSWSSTAENLRSAYRYYNAPGSRGNARGFRVARP